MTKLTDFYKDHKCELLLPQHTGLKLISLAKERLETMSALEEISLSEKEDIVIVGDIHGQVFDLINMLDLFDEPAPRHKYIFNGDFVDRGQWGTEVLFILLGTVQRLLHHDQKMIEMIDIFRLLPLLSRPCLVAARESRRGHHQQPLRVQG